MVKIPYAADVQQKVAPPARRIMILMMKKAIAIYQMEHRVHFQIQPDRAHPRPRKIVTGKKIKKKSRISRDFYVNAMSISGCRLSMHKTSPQLTSQITMTPGVPGTCFVYSCLFGGQSMQARIQFQ